MTEDCLLEKRADGVALITFNRPESLNAMGGQLLPQLVAHLERCACFIFCHKWFLLIYIF